MDVQAFEGLEALDQMKPEWDALFERAALRRPFLTHPWAQASWRHYADGDRPLTVCARDGERLVGLVPLRVKRNWGAERLLFAVSQADYCDLLIEAGREWDVLTTFLAWLKEERTGWDLVRLRAVCSRSASGQVLPVLAQEAGLCVSSVRAGPSPYIALPADGEALELPPRGRQSDHGRKRRKLIRECGDLRTRLIAGGDLTREVFERFLELHRRGWADRGGSAVIPDDRAAQFHVDSATALAPTGIPLILWVSSGERDVGAYYGFAVGRGFLAYIPAFNPDLAAYSPGGQLMLSLIEYGIEQGWTEIDLMRGAERYKFDYTQRCFYVTDHTLARNARTLRLFSLADAARGLLGR